MSCFKPIVAFKPLEGGALIFVERKGYREIKLPCGQCIGCRIRKREEWAVRCYCESRMHRSSHFITLTYNPESMPSDMSLNYRHVQLLLKSMRKQYGPFRYFVCGEYGDEYQRPHWHMLAFGLDISDRVKSNSMFSKRDIFESPSLSGMWKKGFASIGQVTYASARYCAVYTTKRISGDRAEDHYTRVDTATGVINNVVPEFARMSLKPGIGESWIAKYWRDVYVSGAKGVVIDGKVKPVPKFFDRWMEVNQPDIYEGFKFDQFNEAMRYSDDNSRERLAVREECAIAKQRFNRERFGNEV